MRQLGTDITVSRWRFAFATSAETPLPQHAGQLMLLSNPMSEPLTRTVKGRKLFDGRISAIRVGQLAQVASEVLQRTKWRCQSAETRQKMLRRCLRQPTWSGPVCIWAEQQGSYDRAQLRGLAPTLTFTTGQIRGRQHFGQSTVGSD